MFMFFSVFCSFIFYSNSFSPLRNLMDYFKLNFNTNDVCTTRQLTLIQFFSVDSQTIYVTENGVNEALHPLTPPKEGVSFKDEK